MPSVRQTSAAVINMGDAARGEEGLIVSDIEDPFNGPTAAVCADPRNSQHRVNFFAAVGDAKLQRCVTPWQIDVASRDAAAAGGNSGGNALQCEPLG